MFFISSNLKMLRKLSARYFVAERKTDRIAETISHETNLDKYSVLLFHQISFSRSVELFFDVCLHSILHRPRDQYAKGFREATTTA
jgi:hypothetical protein